MSDIRLSSGRTVSNSCPYSVDCWADGYCEDECPPNEWTVLVETAALEHETDLTPHNDPDVRDACRLCRGDMT